MAPFLTQYVKVAERLDGPTLHLLIQSLQQQAPPNQDMLYYNLSILQHFVSPKYFAFPVSLLSHSMEGKFKGDGTLMSKSFDLHMDEYIAYKVVPTLCDIFFAHSFLSHK